MISSEHKFIYIHVPKTGGNSIQERLVVISDDKKESGGRRDGVDRYELKGPITERKHQRLGRYASALPNFSDFKTAVSVRHPLERAVSYYFSPHRWTRLAKESKQPAIELRWDHADFLKALERLPPITDFLKVDGRIHAADFIIRFENLQEDFSAFVAALSLPVASDLPHRNASAADAEIRRRAIEDPNVRREVAQRYAADLEHFGYEI